MNNRIEEPKFMKGALLGALLGGTTCLLLAPKSGKELRDEITNGYNTINQKTQDLTEQIRHHGHKMMHPFEKEETHHNSFLIGGIAGALLGAAVSSLLAPQSGAQLRKTIGKTYEELSDASEDILSTINSKGGEARSEIMDWINLGTKVWNQFQKRR